MMKEEVRGGTDARKLRMRKNPVYILQNCARVVRSGALLMYLILHQTLRAHIYWHPVTIIYRCMQYVACTCLTSFFSARPVCAILNI